MQYPALALLEFDSIAVGIEAADAMVKHAPVQGIYAGTVQPGHYLVMVTGNVASVEEAVKAGQESGKTTLRDQVYLPNIHPDVVDSLQGTRRPPAGDALGIIETHSAAAAIRAADAGIKGADVALVQLRLADGLGGKGLTLFSGRLTNIEAAIEIAAAQAHPQLIRQVIIPQLHPEMAPSVSRSRFGSHFDGWGE